MKIEDTVNRFLSVISQYEFNINDEKELQVLMEKVLIENNIHAKREYSLEPYGVVDFFYENVAFEVKIKGQKKAIYRQCRDYCEHEDVNGLVLITARTMGLPPHINNKPCYVYSLSSNL
jgi:hypothetical protein